MTGRYKSAILGAVCICLYAFAAFAAEDDARTHHLFRQFRCMVCQSQSLDESDAPLAKDLRNVIRERLKQGESDAAIRDYLQARYGDYILFAPPLGSNTLLLWFGPFILLALGSIILWRYIKHQSTRQENADQAPL